MIKQLVDSPLPKSLNGWKYYPLEMIVHSSGGVHVKWDDVSSIISPDEIEALWNFYQRHK